MEISADAKKRIALLIEERDQPLAALAAKIGVSQSTLWNFIYGQTRNFSKIHRLATELKVSLDWILGRATAQSPDAVSRLAEPGESGPDLVPVLGPPGGKGALHLDRRHKSGDTPRHPAQRPVRDAFAVYAAGEAMSPRYYPGELVYIAAGKPPLPGQDCLIELMNGESHLRQFVGFKGGDLVCRQLKPVREWRCKRADVMAIHTVVGRG